MLRSCNEWCLFEEAVWLAEEYLNLSRENAVLSAAGAFATWIPEVFSEPLVWWSGLSSLMTRHGQWPYSARFAVGRFLRNLRSGAHCCTNPHFFCPLLKPRTSTAHASYFLRLER